MQSVFCTENIYMQIAITCWRASFNVSMRNLELQLLPRKKIFIILLEKLTCSTIKIVTINICVLSDLITKTGVVDLLIDQPTRSEPLREWREDATQHLDTFTRRSWGGCLFTRSFQWQFPIHAVTCLSSFLHFSLSPAIICYSFLVGYYRYLNITQ